MRCLRYELTSTQPWTTVGAVLIGMSTGKLFPERTASPMPGDCGVASKIMSSLLMNDSLFATAPGDAIPTAAADCENYCQVRLNLIGAGDAHPKIKLQQQPLRLVKLIILVLYQVESTDRKFAASFNNQPRSRLILNLSKKNSPKPHASCPVRRGAPGRLQYGLCFRGGHR